jgi:hypothetical protein
MPLTRVVKELAPDFAQKQSSATDTTGGAGLIVGAFGLGSEYPPATVNDCNSLLVNGVYAIVSGVNTPGPTSGLLVVFSRNATNSKWQTFYAYHTDNVYLRFWNGATWSAWRPIAGPALMVGTVAQASGVPTGAIIERGSNAQGEYTKFADGTMICAGQLVASALAISTAYQGGFRSAGVSWTFPASFVAAPLGLTAIPHFDTAVSVLRNGFGSTTGNSIVLTAVASQAAADRTISLCAIGRWF